MMARRTTRSRIWTVSGASNPYGVRSLYCDTGESFTFQRRISASGSYDVYACGPMASMDAAASFEIVNSKGTAKVTKDQRTAGRWNLLGRYSFSSQVKVTLRTRGAGGVCADALRFVPAGSAWRSRTPPDRRAERPLWWMTCCWLEREGLWLPSSGENPYGTASLYAKTRSYTFRWPCLLPDL